ncbi:MAG: histidine triad nucleotide-binding protein [Oscillospiraceae bacterium]
MMSCLFCKIVAGEIPSKKIYEDDKVLLFHDVDPKAPVHFLAIPKKHITSANEINAENGVIVADIFVAIAKAAKELGLENGYRIVTNIGEDGGQTVEHMHFHVLGGRHLSWPPG